MSGEHLLTESRELIARARETLAAMPAEQSEPIKEAKRTTKAKEKPTMAEINMTPQVAGQMYSEGKTVIEVARHFGITYGKARKLIAAAGTEIRNPSARLKGRTRTTK